MRSFSIPASANVNVLHANNRKQLVHRLNLKHGAWSSNLSVKYINPLSQFNGISYSEIKTNAHSDRKKNEKQNSEYSYPI